jgi:uncharacterized protein
VNDAEWAGRLVESFVASTLSRQHSVYYIKATGGEVDVAYVSDHRFWPIEIKWTRQLRPKDLRQVLKYSNTRILAKTTETREIQGVPVESLPHFLWALGSSKAGA